LIGASVNIQCMYRDPWGEMNEPRVCGFV